MDSDGYPDEEELERIEKWPHTDILGLFAFVRERWKYANFGYWIQEGRKLSVSTGGWSGNESLIQAMEANQIIFAITCKSWRSGGHYEFSIPEISGLQDHATPTNPERSTFTECQEDHEKRMP